MLGTSHSGGGTISVPVPCGLCIRPGNPGDSAGAGEGEDSGSSYARTREGLRDRSERCDKPDCHKASFWELKQAGITDAHAYKREHGAVPVGHYDICKCRDGTIRIAKVGQCGKTGNFWE